MVVRRANAKTRQKLPSWYTKKDEIPANHIGTSKALSHTNTPKLNTVIWAQVNPKILGKKGVYYREVLGHYVGRNNFRITRDGGSIAIGTKSKPFLRTSPKLVHVNDLKLFSLAAVDPKKIKRGKERRTGEKAWNNLDSIR